jgi:type II secretory pathway pseudopilin PulG
MSHPAIASSRRARRSGQALIATLGVATLLGIVAAVGLQIAQDSNAGTAKEGRTDLALQVADAAVSLYITRLQSDPGYDGHFSDPAEDPRVLASGVTVPPGSSVTAGTAWTYPAGPPQNFSQTIQNARFGAATYNLRVTPATGTQPLTVLATGKVGKEMRSIQAQLAPGSLADFQMVSDSDIAYGATATTDGKLYANGSINHAGHAKERVYASDNVTCARCDLGFFDRDSTPSFSSQFPTPIDFSRFTRSTLDVKQAAQAGGSPSPYYLNAPGQPGWLLQFLGDGTVKIWPITGATNLASTMGALGAPSVVPIPPNGAIYSEQNVVISEGRMGLDSVVRGQVTVVSANNVYIGGNITYSSTGPLRNDVLGLIAANNVYIAEYTPTVLDWWAATIAQSGRWETNPGSRGTHTSMTYHGAEAEKNGGQAVMFNTRSYQWDPGLASTPPPFWPRVGAWVTKYWREVETPK